MKITNQDQLREALRAVEEFASNFDPARQARVAVNAPAGSVVGELAAERAAIAAYVISQRELAKKVFLSPTIQIDHRDFIWQLLADMAAAIRAGKCEMPLTTVAEAAVEPTDVDDAALEAEE